MFKNSFQFTLGISWIDVLGEFSGHEMKGWSILLFGEILLVLSMLMSIKNATYFRQHKILISIVSDILGC